MFLSDSSRSGLQVKLKSHYFTTIYSFSSRLPYNQAEAGIYEYKQYGELKNVIDCLITGIKQKQRKALIKLFKEQIGIPPYTYLTRKRVAFAIKRLTESSSAIAAIARDRGYQDQFTFSKMFKKETGETPSHIRQGKTIQKVMGVLG